MWNPKEIRELAEKDYEKTWIKSVKFLRKSGKTIEWIKVPGKPHPVNDLIFQIRRILLSYGFEEVINPCIVSEDEVKRQYGPEAPVILDRVFYLAGLPRPDIGLSKKKISEIMRIAPNFNSDKVEELKRIFREYKEGLINADDLVEEMVLRLNLRTEEATAILGLFKEFTELKPIPSKMTLRSHMTALWFPILSIIQNKRPLPIKLFSIGIKFRREQKLDETHLYESNVASLVVMAKEITLEDGLNLAKLILSDLGFKNVKFQVKKATSKYYAPGMEVEAFVEHKGKWIEIGDMGLYSPVSLSNYGIKYPVFNAGFGIERIGMIMYDATDIRSLVYPHIYMEIEYSDEEIAKMIRIARKPITRKGIELAKQIIAKALENAEKSSPCRIEVYSGNFLGKNIKVELYENDPNKKLLGPAALNRIYVYNGNILGLPEKGFEKSQIVKEARKKGVKLDFTYLDAIAFLAAAEIENAIKEGRESVDIRVRMAKRPSDVNINIDEAARRYITAKRRKVEVSGPVFVGIKAKIYP